MTTLGSRLRHLDPEHVTFATLPVLSSAAVRVVHGLRVDVVLLDPARTAQLFAGLHDGTGHPAPGTKAAAGQPLTVPPAAFSLEVRNGTSTAGLAGRLARSLRHHGYTVTTVGTASPVDQTTVRYRPGLLAAARTVAAALPGAQLQPDSTLIVGSSSSWARTHRPWSRCTWPAQPHRAGAMADRPPPPAHGCCRRLPPLPARPDQDAGRRPGATGLLCRSAGLPPPDRPRREMRQTDRWLYRPSALPSYLPGHQAGVLRHYTKHGDRSRRLRCGPGRAGLRQPGREGHRGPAHLTWAAPLPTWVGARSRSAGTCGSGYTRPMRYTTTRTSRTMLNRTRSAPRAYRSGVL